MSTKILQLKISLRGVKPPVWRRILVKEDMTFYRLHETILAVMGWTGFHLYEFQVYGEAIGEKDPEWDDIHPVKSAKRVKLSKYAFEDKAKFTYTYDFGDNWVHDILVEKILQSEEGQSYPICIGGKRNCPPEDVGGPWGYQDFLEAIRDPSHPEHENMLKWIGGAFDPEAFDLVETNEALKEALKTR
ncbi:MAG: hypothetical protein BAA01_04140 [Bacillus thermozeamaize]|uniref:Plasmid pRiA4b Orf3-like domain-containing protein n=1 Tax=Bacillus thermozeamaize TaxID=230954 RepID=A0A1Y3PCZ7_9BACI|nr:MAG: hypothetical protein BAA01_04140 [Bacillus thermozeamaize]